jgi:exodeoxyribonuclease VII small subunit
MSKSDSAKTPNDPSFEEAFKLLEATVQKLENGGLTLAEGTNLFEEGMRLAKLCNELLARTELKITQLQTNFSEQMQIPYVYGEDSPEN